MTRRTEGTASRPYIARVMLATVFVLLLGACSSSRPAPQPSSSEALPPVDRAPFSHVRASLDETNAAVVLPLDAYVYSPEEWEVVSSANAYLVEDCVRGQGRPLIEGHCDFEVRED